MAVTITIEHDPTHATIRVEIQPILTDPTQREQPRSRMIARTLNPAAPGAEPWVYDRIVQGTIGVMARTISDLIDRTLSTILAVDNPEHVHGG